MLAKLKKNEAIPTGQAFKERGGRHVVHQPEKARGADPSPDNPGQHRQPLVTNITHLSTLGRGKTGA
jgi:hypothetical protein